MVKNQENKIIRCLKSCLDYCNKVIVMDTGSEDNTVEEIMKFSNSKVKLIQKEWIDDFATMRNEIVKVNLSKWLFFLDSDEIIQKAISPFDFRNILILLEFLARSTPLSISILQNSTEHSSYGWVQRILRKEDLTNYFGKVHEEIRPLPVDSNNLVKINIGLEILNEGTLPSEMEKFNKSTLYAQLSQEMMLVEPNNPKWIYYSITRLETSEEEREKNKELLKQAFLINPDRAISFNNLKESPYLHHILQKYLTLISLGKDYNKLLLLSEICLKKFPMSSYFLFLKYFAKYNLLLKERERLFKQYLIDMSDFDERVSEITTHRSADLLKAIGDNINAPL